MSGRPTTQTDHARHHPAHCMAPGLFRSLKGRSRTDRPALDIRYTWGDAEYHFLGVALGVEDMRVLQALTAIAGVRGLQLPHESTRPRDPHWERLRRTLEDTPADGSPRDHRSATAAALVTSRYRLAVEAGWEPHSARRMHLLLEALERLGAISLYVTHGAKITGPYRLLAFLLDRDTDRLLIALNPHIAATILGTIPSVAYVSLVEARALTTDPSRLLHQWLSAWIGPGQARLISIDAICSHIWPDRATDRKLRDRRLKARASLDEIAALPYWQVTPLRPDTWRISRRRGLPSVGVYRHRRWGVPASTLGCTGIDAPPDAHPHHSRYQRGSQPPASLPDETALVDTREYLGREALDDLAPSGPWR
ncbi:MAG: hypothetical protein HYX75_15110 [Acidobacteria bacterium]|nr:hypothetical protein [Acidobacteriota bacterium]